MKKLLTLILAAIMCLGSLSLVGCGEPSVVIDETKFQLHLGVFNAGYGRTWADETVKDFEAAYADYTEPDSDKKGIQVIVDARKEEFTPTRIIASLPSYDNTLYFLGHFNYSGMKGKNYLVDITDTMNEKVYDENGDVAALTGKTAVTSMVDKAYDETLSAGMTDGKYYAAPWSNNVVSIIADGDLFSEKKLYIKGNGTFGATQEDIDNAKALADEGKTAEAEKLVGKGPDGVIGTADDGFPATYSEYLDLLTEMVKKSVTPFTWSGNTTYQRLGAYKYVWANYEGYDEYIKNFALDSVDENVLNQEGRRAGIQFAYDILSDSNYYSKNAMSQDYQVAQREFVKSGYTEGYKPIAMFFEGSYWESEVRGTSDEMANLGLGYGQRNFKIFPVPNFDKQIGNLPAQTNQNHKLVLPTSSAGQSAIITDKGTLGNKEVKYAKMFLQFWASREQLSKFVKNTGGCFPLYDFEYTESEYASYTKFGQDMMRYIKEGAQLTFDAYKTGKLWNSDNTKYDEYWMFNVKPSTVSYVEPFGAISTEKDVLGKNASEIVNKLYELAVKKAQSTPAA